MYQAVKNIDRMKKSSPLIVKTNKMEQSKTIVKYFNDTFWKNVEPISDLRPTKISSPFTSDKIKKAISKMKLSKSPGCDEISVELSKHTPDVIYQHIADIFNCVASEVDCPNQINNGMPRYHYKILENQKVQCRILEPSSSYQHKGKY